MEFKDYSVKQSIAEQALKKCFPEPRRFDSLLYEAMRYSLFGPGKRFRAVLLLMAYEAFKEDFNKALPTACAIEYIHTYSLIHDDLPSIDNDDLRRGRPTCHKKYGEAIALLAGDALFAEAFSLIAKHQKADSDTIVEIIRELASASGASGMVGGQVLDVNLSGKKNVRPEQLFFIHSHKTGKLITAAAKIGARLGQAKESQLKVIEEYAFNLGMAFQITDDILDETGDEEVMGKSTGSDRVHKKVTYPSVFGIAEARKKALASSQAAIASLKGIQSPNLKRLAEFVISRRN